MVEILEDKILATAMENVLHRIEPRWLKDIRMQAWQQARQLSMPRVDKMRYTHWPQFSTNNQPVPPIPSLVEKDEIAYQLINHGTEYRQKLSLEMQQKGLKVFSFQTAIEQIPETLKAQLLVMLSKANTKMEAYHVALMTTGWIIQVPDNINITERLTILTVQPSANSDNFFNQTLITLGKNSKLNILHEIISERTTTIPAHISINVSIHENAQLEYIGLDQLQSTTSYIKRTAELAEFGRLNWQIIDLNAGNVIGEFTSHLRGAGSESNINVISVTSEREQHGFNTKLLNYGHHSKGEIKQRGVLLDRSKLVFNGIGKIYHGAHGTYANQENRLMMLSKRARGDANPILLIEENDVVAGHAASVGQIDKKQLYYLMSRGLSKQAAQKLVVKGFLSQSIASSIESTLAQRILVKIEDKLGNG